MFSVLGENSRSSNANDLSNSYFLSYGNNSSVVLVLKILKSSENYSTWRRAMLIALIARNKILIHDPLPSVNKAYATIVQEERQRGLTSGYNNSFDLDKSSSSNAGQFVGVVQPFRSKFPKRDAKRPPGKSAGVNFSGIDEGKPEEMPIERDLVASLSSAQCLLAQKTTEANNNSALNTSDEQPVVSHFFLVLGYHRLSPVFRATVLAISSHFELEFFS
uniref:Retrotransposon Copia-like N-terminal domain-containing protein n=1 Tax=Cannabis sativa TaxID=3483 RepID=A0A803QE29_CANSA